MTKKLFTLAIALFLACCVFAGPVQATGNYDYTADVYAISNDTWAGDPGDLTHRTTGITFKVLTVNTDTAATITKFGDNAATAVTNPVTAANFALTTVCNTKVRFRSTASTVDLIVVDTVGGYTAFIEDFSPNMHKIYIDERPNVEHHGVIWVTGASGTETATGVSFEYDTFVRTVQYEGVTAEGTASTLDVGLLSSGASGDYDGFINGVDVNATSHQVLVFGTRGAYLDDATDIMLAGFFVCSARTQSLTYTCITGACANWAGYLHYWFTRVR